MHGTQCLRRHRTSHLRAPKKKKRIWQALPPPANPRIRPDRGNPAVQTDSKKEIPSSSLCRVTWVTTTTTTTKALLLLLLLLRYGGEINSGNGVRRRRRRASALKTLFCGLISPPSSYGKTEAAAPAEEEEEEEKGAGVCDWGAGAGALSSLFLVFLFLE